MIQIGTLTAVILLPLRPASLMHKNPQRHSFPWKVLKFLCKSSKSHWIVFNFNLSGPESVFWRFLVV